MSCSTSGTTLAASLQFPAAAAAAAPVSSAAVMPRSLADLVANPRQQMSMADVARLRAYVASTSHLTLEQIDRALSASRVHLSGAQEQLARYSAAEGVEVSVLNRVLRRTEAPGVAQAALVAAYAIDDAQGRFAAFVAALLEQVAEYEAYVDALTKLRSVFTTMYPEAQLSPRTARTQLETSPTRHSFPKSKSSPSLTPRRTNSATVVSTNTGGNAPVNVLLSPSSNTLSSASPMRLLSRSKTHGV